MLWSRRDGTGPRLVLVHGFTQTSAFWPPIEDHEIVRIDAPGHGRSPIMGFEEGVVAIGAAGGAATYIGYSMGGRYCLHLALARADLARGLVLIGATAGIVDPSERSARIAADEALARRLEEEGLNAFLSYWLSLDLFAGLTGAARNVEARRENTVKGLAASLRLAGTGTHPPVWHELGRLAIPVLCVAGEDDTKFVALAERMADAIGRNAALALVPGAGHACHLERQEAFTALLLPWLKANGL